MKPSYRSIVAGAAIVAVSTWYAVPRASDEYAGTDTCAACHEETVASFSRSAHAVAKGWDAVHSCESCHGPGATHADSGDPDDILNLGDLPPREASQYCVDCHKRQPGHFSAKRGIHRLGDVGCNDCHNPHSIAENLLDRTGEELCSQCHGAIAAQFDLPRAHPLGEGGSACASCHEPHGTRTLRANKSLYDKTCSNCHFEKQGPFVYPHDVVMVDGCASCHEVHGSPNRHLLKHEPQVNLCYQCHSASVTPAWHSTPRFLNEKCTACHTAIHGSNSNPFFLEE